MYLLNMYFPVHNRFQFKAPPVSYSFKTSNAVKLYNLKEKDDNKSIIGGFDKPLSDFNQSWVQNQISEFEDCK